MLDLVWGYLLIITLLFSANIGLFLGNINLNDIKNCIISLVLGILFFIVISISSLFTFNLLDYLAYLFIIMAVIIFFILIYYLKNNDYNTAILICIILFYISSFLLSSQISEYSIVNSLILAIISIAVMIIAFQSSKLLKYAKRQYNFIIGEYMSLEGILIFLFALTYYSALNLNHEMFSSFLILTPTYKLIYVIIGIVVVLIIGSYLNDKKNLR